MSKDFESNFSTQYNRVYIERIQRMTPLLIESVTQLFPHKYLTDTILKKNYIQSKNHKTEINIIILGVLFISTDKKPSVFEEMKPLVDSSHINSRSYYSQQTEYFIEDEKGRLKVILNEDCALKYTYLCTGIVAAFHGIFRSDGIFEISEITFPNQLLSNSAISEIENEVCFFKSEQIENEESSKKIKKSTNSKEFLILISDPSFEDNNNIKKIALLTQSVKNLQQKSLKEVILLGPLTRNNENTNIVDTYDTINTLFEGALAKHTFIPHFDDETSSLFPLDPFHHRILCNTSSLENPCIYKAYKKTFILSSGENVVDILKYHSEYDLMINKDLGDDKIAEMYFCAMIQILSCGYLCPTSPDTLKSMPFCLKSDCFFINEQKIDYFIVKAPVYGQKHLKNGTKLILVPSFGEFTKVLLLDLETGFCKPADLEF